MKHPPTFDGKCSKCGKPLTLLARCEPLDQFVTPHPSHGPMLRNRFVCDRGHVNYELGYRKHLEASHPKKQQEDIE